MAGGCEPFPVGAERHALHPVAMATEGNDIVGCNIPDLDGSVPTPPCQDFAPLGMERHAFHIARRIGPLMQWLPGLGIPDSNDAIISPRSYQTVIAAERHTAKIVPQKLV